VDAAEQEERNDFQAIKPSIGRFSGENPDSLVEGNSEF
jgi:hypothetical protein